MRLLGRGRCVEPSGRATSCVRKCQIAIVVLARVTTAAISFSTNPERPELLASTLHLYRVTPAVLPYLLSPREPHAIVLISSFLLAHSTFLSADQCQRPRAAV